MHIIRVHDYRAIDLSLSLSRANVTSLYISAAAVHNIACYIYTYIGGEFILARN